MLLFLMLVVIIGISIFVAINMVTKDKDFIKSYGFDKMDFNRAEEPIKDTIFEAIRRFDISPELIEDYYKEYVYVLDTDNEQIALLTSTPSEEYEATYFDFKNIVDVSLEVIKETVTSTTSNNKKFKGALVGGVLAGTTGAIIGSQSGSNGKITTTEEMVSKIQLKLLMVNTANSSMTITFMHLDEPISKVSELFKDKFSKATEWENELKVYMLQTKSIQTNFTSSVADEIKKLHVLVQDGILTDEEFALQKEKILSR